MKKFFKRLLKDNRGVTAIEYGLIAGLVAVAITASVTSLGSDLTATFDFIGGKLSATVPAAA